MEPTMPQSRVHNITAEGMEFTIMETLRASIVEMWLRDVKQRFLDAAPIKCVGLDCEFTSPREGKRHQHAVILQLSVVSEVLVFQICRADHVPQLLKDFLKDPIIRFCGAAIGNDVRMLESYRIEIPSVYDLQRIMPNPTKNPIPSIYDLSNTFSPALLVPVAPTETNMPYKLGPMVFFPPVDLNYSGRSTGCRCHV
jgi:hypothetical protein